MIKGLKDVDFWDLFGGNSFVVATQIVNGMNVFSTTSLVNSGALGLTFVNTPYAIGLSCQYRLEPCIHPLGKPISTTGFDSHTSKPILHVFLPPELHINRHTLACQLMLMTHLGKHDIILGKNWLARHDIWLDIKNE